MSRTIAVRWFDRALSGNRKSHSRTRLAVETLEDRSVPANNLTITDGGDVNIDVQNPGFDPTSTIRTTGGGAQLSLATLENELRKVHVQTVIVTTAPRNPPADDDEMGNILWDATVVVDSLDFTDFGTGKKLIFRTVDGTSAVGNITLTAVQFLNGGSNDQISLEFDSSATNGDISFQTDGATSDTVTYSAEAILDLTVNAGTGAFNFSDDGITINSADAGGSVSITADQVTIISSSGLTAFGAMSIVASANVQLGSLTGLLAGTDLTIDALGVVNASDGGFTAENGRISVSGTEVSLTSMFVTAANGLTIEGADSILVDAGAFDVFGDLSLTSSGPVDLTDVDLPTLGDVTVSGSAVSLTTTSLRGDGPVAITGTSIGLNAVTLEAGGNISVTGPVDLQGSVEVLSSGNVSFSDVVDGTADLGLYAVGTLTFAGHVGPVNTLNSLTLLQGNMSLGTHDLSAGTVTVGQLLNPIEATIGLTGTLTGNLDVLPTGNLSPGGLGVVGTMTVTGNVNLDGDFAVDLGTLAIADQLIVNGNMTIGPSSMLGAGLGTGHLAFSSFVIIDYAGTLAGTFINAQTDVPVLVGMDAVRVSEYSPDVTIVPFTTGEGTTVFGIDSIDDATGFKAVLTGGGKLVTGKDWTDSSFLIARGTTILSKLTITTIANGSDDVVTFPAGVLISGPLVSFTAPKVNIGTQFRASGAVTTATFRDFLNAPGGTGIQFGGELAKKTTIAARNIVGSVKVGSTLNTLKVAQVLGAQVLDPSLEDSVVSAPAIGKVTARSATTNFVSPGAITSIAFTGEYSGDISAGSLGAFSAGKATGDLQTLGAITSFKSTGAFRGTIESASIGKFEAGSSSDAKLFSTGPIGSITGKGADGLTLELTASQVGPIKVEGELNGDGLDDGPDIKVTNGITSMTVGSIFDLAFSAKFLGAVAVNGSTTFGISGDVVGSSFAVTGNDGTLAQNAIKSFTAKGNVRECRFDVKAGNVTTFTVGRFLDSQLYLNYTPSTLGDFTLGVFGLQGFKLGAFKTTAVPTIDPLHPLHWAFRNSEVVADTIGALTLSGLQTDNGTIGFGIKVRQALAVVKVIKVDDPLLATNVNLNPDRVDPLDPLAGDFFYLDV